ncbi:hypothetical protein SAMN06296386_10189 [Lachnospiraceae bacterium]|nr:hypothetical protein SAMN06296386_10189 [Lachnospiraceae bacterium]
MVNNEVELTRTVDTAEKGRLISMLVRNRVSYLEKWTKVSIFHRKEYNGAKEVCVIYVNDNQKEQAFAILEDFKQGKGVIPKNAAMERLRGNTNEETAEEGSDAE